jgi:hypothetical protein
MFDQFKARVTGRSIDATPATPTPEAEATPAEQAPALPLSEAQLSIIDKMMLAQAEILAERFDASLKRFLAEAPAEATPATPTSASKAEATPATPTSASKAEAEAEALAQQIALYNAERQDIANGIDASFKALNIHDAFMTEAQRDKVADYVQRGALPLCFHSGSPVLFYRTAKSKQAFRLCITESGSGALVKRSALVNSGALESDAIDTFGNAPILHDDAMSAFSASEFATPTPEAEATPATPTSASKAEVLPNVHNVTTIAGSANATGKRSASGNMKTIQGSAPPQSRFACKRSKARADDVSVGMAYHVQLEQLVGKKWKLDKASDASAIERFVTDYLTANVTALWPYWIGVIADRAMLWLYFGNVSQRHLIAHDSPVDRKIKAVAIALNTHNNRSG